MYGNESILMKTKSLLFISCLLIIAPSLSFAQWLPSSSGMGSFGVVPLIYSDYDSTLYAGTLGDGIYKSTNAAGSWSISNNGLTNGQIFALLSVDSTLFAGSFGAGIFKSTNHGASWVASNTGISNMSIYALAGDSSNIYAGTLGGGVFKSSDDGANWTAVNNGLANLSIVHLYATDSLLFAGTVGNGMYISNDAGSTWTALNNGLSISATVRCVTTDGNDWYAGTAGDGVYYSNNQGASWTQVINGLTNYTVWTLKVINHHLFAGTNNGGVFLSSNQGASWTPINAGFPGPPPNVWAFLVQDSTLYVSLSGIGGTTTGVYKQDLNQILTQVPEGATWGDESSIYPNPFSETAQVSLRNNTGNEMQYFIYNLFGELIEKSDIFTQNSFILNRNNLAQGTYIFELHSGQKIISRKKFSVLGQ